MKVHKIGNTVECIMDLKDLENYGIASLDLQNSEMIQEAFSQNIGDIIQDINKFLKDDEQIMEGPIQISIILSKNCDSALLRLNNVSNDNKEDKEIIPQSYEIMDEIDIDEIKDYAFAFETMNDAIRFAKIIYYLINSLKVEKENFKKRPYTTKEDSELEIPENIPDFVQHILERARDYILQCENQKIDDEFNRINNFDGFPTKLYEYNGTYYFICENVSYSLMKLVPYEFCLTNPNNSPSVAYIYEHGNAIIINNASEKLSIV